MMTPENAPASKDMNQEDPFGADPGLFADADSGLPIDTDSDLPADMDRGPSAHMDSDFSADRKSVV